MYYPNNSNLILNNETFNKILTLETEIYFEPDNLLLQEILTQYLLKTQYSDTILAEVALDDYKNGKAIKLDKEGKWYIDIHGKTIRHAKVIFKTHQLQQEICSTYINHDPTKSQDKCIEVLLCKPNGINKWIAISTLRKLDTNCISKHPLTYALHPPDVFKKAIKYTKAIPPEEKLAVLDKYMAYREQLKNTPEFQNKIKQLEKEKPVIINNSKDLIKLLLK